MGDPEIASCPPSGVILLGLMRVMSCLYYCNLALPSRQCAQHALYLWVPMVPVHP
jgi:hypothetical protein